MSNEIQIAPPSLLSPMEMVQVAFQEAVKQGAAAEMVTLILEQQKWLIQQNEKQNFNESLKRIQKKLQAIQKRGWNPDTKSHFATSFDVHNAIQPHLDEEGMTLSFKPAVSEKIDMVLVIGVLSLGAYEKEYPLEMPADGKGAKGGGVMSRTHATGAGIKYAKRYLKDMIFDLNTFGPDDDGNAAGPLSDAIKATVNVIMDSRDMDVLKEKYRKEYKAAVEANDSAAVKAFMDAYGKRKEQLTYELA